MKISDEMRTAAREAIYSVSWERLSTSEADAVIAAVAPLILEEAAKAVEVLPGMMAASPTHVKATGPKECAAVIRALSPTSNNGMETPGEARSRRASCVDRLR